VTSVKFCVALAAAACIGVFIGAPAASADPAGSYGPAVSKDTGPGGIIRSCVRTQAAGQPQLLGAVRIIDGPGLVFQVPPPPCNFNETELDWPSVQGGATGATGPSDGRSGSDRHQGSDRPDRRDGWPWPDRRDRRQGRDRREGRDRPEGHDRR